MEKERDKVLQDILRGQRAGCSGVGAAPVPAPIDPINRIQVDIHRVTAYFSLAF